MGTSGSGQLVAILILSADARLDRDLLSLSLDLAFLLGRAPPHVTVRVQEHRDLIAGKHTRVQLHILNILTEYVAFIRYTPILARVFLPIFFKGTKTARFRAHVIQRVFSGRDLV